MLLGRCGGRGQYRGLVPVRPSATRSSHIICCTSIDSDSFFREQARRPSEVWSRTKMTKIMGTRVRTYKGHSFIVFDIERPGTLVSTLSEADFPNLNQHDIKTIIRWLKVASNIAYPTKLFLKRIRQYIYEMLYDFSVDCELAHECNYKYTLKPKTYKKELEGSPPGIVNVEKVRSIFNANSISSSLYDPLLNKLLDNFSSLESSVTWNINKVEDLEEQLEKSRFACEEKRIRIEQLELAEENVIDENLKIRNENKMLLKQRNIFCSIAQRLHSQLTKLFHNS
ncbi:hypothetical protein LXL04_020454 [Taraxacum kok-saghyz]